MVKGPCGANGDKVDTRPSGEGGMVQGREQEREGEREQEREGDVKF